MAGPFALSIARTLGKLSDTERIALTELCERLVSTLAKQRLEQRAAGFTPAGGAPCRMCDLTACGRDKGTCPIAQVAVAQSQVSRPKVKGEISAS
jgi:hypothetical protein